MPNYKILSCDLDGTLLGPESTFSAENNAAIHTLSERGVTFIINTGRTYAEIPQALKNHPAIPYVICSNGAAIYDQKSGKITRFGMTSKLSSEVLDILLNYDVSLSFRQQGICYVDAQTHNDSDYAAHRISAEWRRFFYQNATPRGDFFNFCRNEDEVEMICAFFANEQERSRAAKHLGHLVGVQLASSAPENLEIFSAKAGKGSALLHLAASLGIAAEDTIAVGDTSNDKDMILKAGLGLAMGNAYPELKAQADATICRNTEHAADYILKHYFSNETSNFKAF